jgi:hypothetical protein
VDGNGYVWRVYPPGTHGDEGYFSMCPVNPDNRPVPEPITYYHPQPQHLSAAVQAFLDWYDGAFDAAADGRAWPDQTEAVEVLRSAVGANTPQPEEGEGK